MLNLEYCVGLSIFLYCFSVKKLPAEPVSSRVASASSLKRVNSVLCHVWFANRTHQNTEFTVMNDNLSHTSWKCSTILYLPRNIVKKYLWSIENRYRKNFTSIMRIEKSGNTRGKRVSGCRHHRLEGVGAYHRLSRWF